MSNTIDITVEMSCDIKRWSPIKKSSILTYVDCPSCHIGTVGLELAWSYGPSIYPIPCSDCGAQHELQNDDFEFSQQLTIKNLDLGIQPE